MDDEKDAAQARAERAFKRKEEGAKAMSDYETEGRAVRKNMDRLRALRLDKEAKEKASPVAKMKPASVPSKAPKARGQPTGKAGANAAEMAGHVIDRAADKSATDDERASRKRRLLKGPKEFRDFRKDRPKPKR